MSTPETSKTPTSRLTMRRREGDGQLTLVLKGALDVTAGQEHGPAILAAVHSTPVLVLDVKELDYISSAGVRILIQLHKDAFHANCKVRLTSLTPLVEEVLEISGIRDYFDIV